MWYLCWLLGEHRIVTFQPALRTSSCQWTSVQAARATASQAWSSVQLPLPQRHTLYRPPQSLLLGQALVGAADANSVLREPGDTHATVAAPVEPDVLESSIVSLVLASCCGC